MKLGKASAWAKTIGAGLAVVQNGIDKLAEFGFDKLKKAGSSTEKRQPKNPYAKQATKLLGTTITFIGQLGDSYYQNYEELKRGK